MNQTPNYANATKKQFRGIWIPADIFKLLEDGSLTSREIILATLIDALVDEKFGCYASNAYFANILKCSQDTVTRMIAKLIKLKVIRHLKFDGKRRYLETAWSQPIKNSLGNFAEAGSGILRRHDFPKENINNKAYRSDMGFFEKYDEKMPDDWHHQFACKLFKLLQKHRSILTKPKMTSWAKTIKQLEKQTDGDRQKIEDVFTWLIENYREQYTPKIYSASTFKNKFVAIEVAMKRSQKYQVQLTKLSEELYQQLRDLPWPKDSELQLQTMIQISLNNLASFLRKFKKYKTNAKTNREVRRIVLMFDQADNQLFESRRFVLGWTRHTFEKIKDWDQWNGDLCAMAFHQKTKQFHQQICELSKRHFGNTSYGNAFMKAINEN